MRSIIFVILLFYTNQVISAQKYISKNGHIWFIASTPLENIEAHNNQAVSILDAANGTIQFTLLIKSFEFRIALMQEHFNENYMESDKIPKAGFKGKIENQSEIDFNKDGVYTVKVTGELSIHDVTRPVTTNGTITVSGNMLVAKAKFTVMPKDYDIDIPAVVENKIAKEVEINVDVTYYPN